MQNSENNLLEALERESFVLNNTESVIMPLAKASAFDYPCACTSYGSG